MHRGRFGRDEHRYRDAQRGPSTADELRQRGSGGGERGVRGEQRDQFAERFDDEYFGDDDSGQMSGSSAYEGERDSRFARAYPRAGDERRDHGERDRSGSNWRRGQTSMGGGFGETGSNDRGGFGASSGGYVGSQGRHAGESSGSYDYQGRQPSYGGARGGHAEYGVYGQFGQERHGLQRQAGQYAGRGPRGYQRADERIREEVCDLLTIDPDIDATDVTVEIKGGEVVLSGTVADREQKRCAEDVAESVQGVTEVRNELRVKRDERQGTMGGSESAHAKSGQQSAAQSGMGGSSSTQQKNK